MKNVFLILATLLSYCSYGQNGVIKGKIIDKQSEVPLVGATVSIANSTTLGTISDDAGSFEINNVPLGRQILTISLMGYTSATVPNIDVTSGKDVFLTIALIETYNSLNEVVVKSESTKARAINKMAAVSSRQFTVEEVNRYAGGRSDVARLVSNFAGVSAANDSRNDIVVRGNSPAGMLWRIEGIPVPSPNHFSL